MPEVYNKHVCSLRMHLTGDEIRRLVHSGCKSHPGTGSFHPVAIGAAVEATKLLKPPMQEGREDDSASVQA